jgi:hypothetical protein
MVVMEYMDKKTRKKSHLVLYPFKKGELRALISETGFKNINSYGDYIEHHKPKNPDFITYICKK